MRLFHPILTVFATFLLFQPAFADNKDSERQLYIRKYKNLAISEMKRRGIPASIILAQGMLESDCGKSRLAVEANNHFGIKCHGWQGASIYEDDEEIHECFRKYDNAKQSYRDHSDFLYTSPRYASLFALSSSNYRGWAKGLQDCGYATDPKYAERLVGIVESCGLSRYDVQNATGFAEDGVQYELFEDNDPALFRMPLERTVLVRNGAPYIIACSSDTYQSIAKEYGLFVWELVRFNHLKHAPARLEDGTAVFIGRQ
jgi:Muramidase (flagellum-specific)